MSDTEATEPTQAAIDIDAVVTLLEQADAPLAERILGALETAFASRAVPRDALRRCRTLITAATDATLPAAQQASDLSTLRVAVGTPSADGSCVLGHDGYVFLTEGSNYVLSRYDRDPASTEDLAQRWCALFDERARRQRNAGRLFMQFIVPEKISSVPEHLPFSLRTPTDLLDKIETHFRSDSWQEKSVPVLDLFRIAGPRCFARLDSHQSAYGSYLVADHVANLFGYRGLFGLPFTRTGISSGDLAYRFFGTPLYEETQLPDMTNHPVLGATPELIETYSPPSGGHNQSRYVWRNPGAPIKMRVVAFGNSCFERGGFPFLSWWFSMLFEEFHFVWSNVVDDAYATGIRADLVIGQTMERFLFVADVAAS